MSTATSRWTVRPRRARRAIPRRVILGSAIRRRRSAGSYFRPQVHGDYFYLNQGAYTEHGGGTAAGDGFDLAVAQRNGNEASGTASLVTGITFGQGFRWRPELELGYRDVVQRYGRRHHRPTSPPAATTSP